MKKIELTFKEIADSDFTGITLTVDDGRVFSNYDEEDTDTSRVWNNQSVDKLDATENEIIFLITMLNLTLES